MMMMTIPYPDTIFEKKLAEISIRADILHEFYLVYEYGVFDLQLSIKKTYDVQNEFIEWWRKNKNKYFDKQK